VNIVTVFTNGVCSLNNNMYTEYILLNMIINEGYVKRIAKYCYTIFELNFAF